MRTLLTSMGEILIDFIPLVEHNTTVGFRMYPGGSPCNVAVGIARLGQPAAFLGKLSQDFFGNFLREHLTREDVATHLLLSDTLAPTTLSFVALEAGEPVYTFYGQNAADTRLLPDELPATCFAETRLLHFGSISLLHGSTPSAVLAAVERLQGQVLLSFDPNLRPSMVRDEPAYRTLIERLLVCADLVKVSAADMAWLAPERSLEEAAADMLALGAVLVVVTRGHQGVLALRVGTSGRVERWELPACQVAVVDTVGAGDALSAGLLTALVEQGVDTRQALQTLPSAELASALRFAIAVAALACTRPGADSPARREVDRFLRESCASG